MTATYNRTRPDCREVPGLEQGELKASRIWIYGSLGFPLSLLGYPLGIWLPRAYATYVGVATEQVGLIIFVAAVFDAITDPIMGFASDRFRTRWGRRRIWIAIGMPFLMAALFYLLNPPLGSTVLYLGFWFVFLRVGTTMVGIPYGAWGAELSSEYHTRTRIVSARQTYVLLGLIGAAAVPAVVEWIHADATTAVMVLNAYTLPALVLLPLLTLLVVALVPEPPARTSDGQISFLRSLTLMSRNRLFLRLITIEVLISGGEAFRNALSLFFMQDYIGAPRAGSLYLVYFGMGLAAIPFWTWLAKRYGKHRSLSSAIVFVGCVSIAIYTLEHGQVMPFYVLFALKGFCFGSFAYLPSAMLADVIDVDTFRSGAARTGSYFSIMGFMTKLAHSVGGFALVALSWVGYDTTVGASHSAQSLEWLAILYAIVPTVAFAFGLYLCWTWPLTQRKQERLRRLIEIRQTRHKGLAIQRV